MPRRDLKKKSLIRRFLERGICMKLDSSINLKDILENIDKAGDFIGVMSLEGA